MAVALSAISNPGLVVVVADSEFAPFTITTGASISCPGVACIVNTSGGLTGITIAAGASDTIVLSGVSVSGFGSGGTGINVTSAGKVEFGRGSISGNNTGINFSPTSGTNTHLFLHDSEVRYSTGLNLSITPSSGANVSAVFAHARIHHGRSGVVADASSGGISLVFEDSTINFNTNNGIAVVAAGSGCPASPSGPFGRIITTRSAISHVATGVNSIGCSAQVFLDSTLITQTTTPVISSSNGTVTTTSNNPIGFNTNPVSGPLGHFTLQ